MASLSNVVDDAFLRYHTHKSNHKIVTRCLAAGSKVLLFYIKTLDTVVKPRYDNKWLSHRIYHNQNTVDDKNDMKERSDQVNNIVDPGF